MIWYNIYWCSLVVKITIEINRDPFTSLSDLCCGTYSSKLVLFGNSMLSGISVLFGSSMDRNIIMPKLSYSNILGAVKIFSSYR